MECLGHVESDEVFRKLAEVLADAVQRPVFAVPANISPLLYQDVKIREENGDMLTPG
jgi:hypothetical protein